MDATWHFLHNPFAAFEKYGLFKYPNLAVVVGVVFQNA